MYDETILYYPFPIYFFVKRKNKELKNQIEQGLEALIDSGEFETLLRKHPVTNHLYPLEKWKDKRIIKLTNPFLSEDTNIGDSRYWVDL